MQKKILPRKFYKIKRKCYFYKLNPKSDQQINWKWHKHQGKEHESFKECNMYTLVLHIFSLLFINSRLVSFPRRSNQSILKEINPGISLEGMMLKLKLQYFGHLMWRADSLEKTLILISSNAGGEGDDRGWDGWMASLTRWMRIWVNSGSWWWTGRPGVLRFMGSQRVDDWVIELNWTEVFPVNKTYL